MDRTVSLDKKKFDKLEFLTAFQVFYTQTFKSIIIYHVFKSHGQVPFNLNINFDKICKKQA